MKNEFYKNYALYLDKLFSTHGHKLSIWKSNVESDSINKKIEIYVPHISVDWDKEVSKNEEKKFISYKIVSKDILNILNNDSKNNDLIQLDINKNNIMIKTWLLNTIKFKPSEEDFKNIYKKVFSSLKLSDIIYFFGKSDKKYLFYALSEGNNSNKDHGFNFTELRYNLNIIKSFNFSKEEMKEFLPVLLRDYSLLDKKEFNSSHYINLEDQIYGLLRNTFTLDEMKQMSSYFPNKQKFLNENVSETKDFFINNEGKNIFLELSVDYIKTNYNSLIIKEDFNEMFFMIMNIIEENLNELDLISVNDCVDTDNPQIIMKLKKDGYMTEDKLKTVVLKLTDFYGKEKEINKKFNKDYLEASFKMILLNEKIEKKDKNTNIKRNKI